MIPRIHTCHNKRSLFLSMTIFVCSCAWAQLDNETPRQWTDIDGRKITATLISAKADSAELNIDSKVYAVPLHRLSMEDRLYIRKAVRPEETHEMKNTDNQDLPNHSSLNHSDGMVGTGLVLGDSTVATHAGGTQISSFLYTEDQLNDGWKVTSIAVPGHTIAQQKKVYLSTESRGTVDYTLVQIGLNDLHPDEASSVAIARLQDLINTINSNKKAGSKVIISAMIPCRKRLIHLYGATKGPISQQKWIDMNKAIKGNGPTPITGVDYRISSHVALLDDGDGNLKRIYDTGDHIHQNNAARKINARVWRDSLAEIGLLRPDSQ